VRLGGTSRDDLSEEVATSFLANHQQPALLRVFLAMPDLPSERAIPGAQCRKVHAIHHALRLRPSPRISDVYNDERRMPGPAWWP
jgi:hypothetical protein